MTDKRIDVVVLIPCYQGAHKIAEVIADVRAIAPALPIVVVDDGSADDSAKVAAAAGATVLRHARNQGKGAALATGFAHAKQRGARAVLTLDADGQHRAAEIPAMLAAHEQNPDALVLGVRSFDPNKMPARSRFGNRFSTWWISLFARHSFSDTQTGFRIYPTAFVSDLPLQTHRFDTETEILFWAAHKNIAIVEQPIATVYGSDHVSHFRGFADSMRVLRLVVSSPVWLRTRS